MARFNLQTVAVDPPTPAPGFASIYFKNDNILYIKDSSGLVTPIGTASAITALAGDVSGLGPGIATTTVDFVGGKTAAEIATSVDDTQGATATNTPSKIVKRGPSGDFAAGMITANLTGNVTGAASANVLKSGDTMTGALTISASDVAALKVGTNILVVDSTNGRIGVNKLTPTQALDVVGNGQFTGTLVAFNLSGTNTGNIALLAAGSTPNANGASLSGATGQDLTLQPADGTHPGILTALAQNIGGAKTFLAALAVSDTTQSVDKDSGSIVTEGGLGVEKNINAGGNINAVGTVSGSNLAGSNSGDVTLGPVGAAPNANSASLAGQVLTLQPADGTHPGVLTILAQSIQGIKTFLAKILVSDTTQSVDKDSGSIITEGGVGVEKNINAGGNIAAVGTLAGSNFSGASSGTNTGDVSLNAVGSSPNANGSSLSGQSLTLQPADGTNPGLLTALAQSIGGIKTFLAKILISDTTQSVDKDTGSLITEGGIGVEKNINAGGTILGSNLSGTNTGNIALQAVGSTPNANGSSLGGTTGQDLTLQPADGTNPGILTAIAQTIGGIKTFLAQLIVSDTTDSSSSTTGSIKTAGGLGVAKKIYAGSDVVAGGNMSAANLAGTNTGNVTFQAVGSSPNANGGSLGGGTGQDITLQPADGTNPGVLTALAQSIGGIKTHLAKILISDTTQSVDKDSGSIITEGGIGVEKNINAGGTILGSNLSGTNTGNVTLQPVGSTPNANGSSLGGTSGQELTLQPADGTNPGILTTLAQTIAGIKTHLAKILISDTTQSVDKDTGSLITEGGIGVEKNINAGGNIAAVGTIAGSNFSGSSSGTNTGDVTKTDTNSIALTLTGQNLSADLKLSTDAATAETVKSSATIHASGLHVETPYDTPVNVGTTNNAGTGGKFASFDHVHAITWPVIAGLIMSTYTVGANAVLAATDSIVVAFGKLQGQINAIVGSAVTSLTGDVTGTGPGATATTISVGAVTDTKASLAVKPPVTVVATTNQTLSGTPTIDGQTTTAGTSIILLTAQTTGADNGPWIAQVGAWTRPTWYPNGGMTQAFQFITALVRLGTVYGGSNWRQTTAGPITIGTTSTTWTVVQESGNYKSEYDIGPQSGSADVILGFKNAFAGLLAWNPTANFTIKLPPTQGANGTVPTNDGSGNLTWSNPNTNIDGGRPDSVYTASQSINGGTP